MLDKNQIKRNMKYPIGIQSFEEIRLDNYTYVDKTGFVFKMVSEGKYYFLSRPRRFGKSMLLSTFEAFFEGKRELFEGLYIYDKVTEWQAYPILHLDLNTREYKDEQSLRDELNKHLEKWEGLYGNQYQGRALEERFTQVIELAYQQTGKQVVILVDEYDKPLLQTIDKPSLQTTYRNTLKAFYGALKSCDKYIKFAFLTGVTKFGKVSVFSDLNNLKDISMLPAYATICGMTEDEVHKNFDDEVEKLAENVGLSKAECYEKLALDYDGYHFDVGTPGMYNPFSLLNTLDNKVFRDYWFETGTPSFLVHQLQKVDYLLENMTHEELTADTLNSIDIMDSNPLPLLYQSGYLTLKDYDKRFNTYLLDFPNREVREGFIKYLVPYYTPQRSHHSPFSISAFIKAVERGDAEGLMRQIENMFANGDYQIMGDKEVYFHNAISLLFMLMGFYVDVERRTTDGRIDMLVQTSDYIYIFEFKIDQSADVALNQIEEKGYAKAFDADKRKLFKVGVNFSTVKRKVDDWKVVERANVDD